MQAARTSATEPIEVGAGGLAQPGLVQTRGQRCFGCFEQTTRRRQPGRWKEMGARGRPAEWVVRGPDAGVNLPRLPPKWESARTKPRLQRLAGQDPPTDPVAVESRFWSVWWQVPIVGLGLAVRRQAVAVARLGPADSARGAWWAQQVAQTMQKPVRRPLQCRRASLAERREPPVAAQRPWLPGPEQVWAAPAGLAWGHWRARGSVCQWVVVDCEVWQVAQTTRRPGQRQRQHLRSRDQPSELAGVQVVAAVAGIPDWGESERPFGEVQPVDLRVWWRLEVRQGQLWQPVEA